MSSTEPASSYQYLNNSACVIKHSPGKGRGVFAARAIASQNLVEISPVLLFNKEEYEKHGKFTILDEYTFKWTNGRMALALGSLFNHSNFPNVSYTIDPSTDSIRYTATRNIEPDEELCIYYGTNLWFDPIGPSAIDQSQDEKNEDGWGGLSNLDLAPNILPNFLNGSLDDIVPEEDLPFERFKPPPEEETAETIQTLQAWAVDVPDQRSIGPMLKWLKRSELDAAELGHLKRVRKQGETSTFLLSISPTPPSLPQEISLPDPFLVTIPSSAAVTTTSLALKNVLWPTIYAPRRKGEVEDWSRGKARWAWEAMHVVVQEALRWRDKGELPVVAYVPAPYEAPDGASPPSAFIAHDTRQSAAHPLRHAVMNVIRKIADHRARSEDVESTESPPDTDSPRNGTNYLLTSQILFTTHEPCIMCSMALLHSRVKEVVYMLSMEKTGGCGSSICLPTLPGVNHRFGICQWKGETIQEAGLQLDVSVDA
ncbi:cytidine deaminase-like protein [Mycena galericulata]|nr:cytidine deaminase-like protein [Mycena galericulata]